MGACSLEGSFMCLKSKETMNEDNLESKYMIIHMYKYV